MNSEALVGMHFVFDNTGERYRIGEISQVIIGKDSRIYYLLKFDAFKGSPQVPFELICIEDLTLMNEETGMREFSLFATREDLNIWVKWIESPPEGEGEKVVSLIKTGKHKHEKED
jgi:hypothetical protein